MGLFAEIVGREQNMFLEHANLLKKLSFPRLCLPVIVVTSALLNFAIVFCLFTVFLIASDNFPGWSYLGLALIFNVININKPHFAGLAWIDPQISIEQL